MAYDPQANRRRPKPEPTEAAPVEALLGEPRTPIDIADDPPPSPAVTPEPADPIPDKLFISSGVATAIGGLVALLALRHLWMRRRRTTDEGA
jgi:hypothetical protein